MAGIFPAMGNPAAGVNAASGLGNQFLGFLSNLPQQLMQWEQLRQQRQGNAYQNFQILSQIGMSMPQLASNPRYAKAFGQTLHGLGIDPKEFMQPDGTLNPAIFSSQVFQKLVADPTVYKELQNTPTNQRQAWWEGHGGTGPAPQALVNAPFIPAWTPSESQGLERRISNVSIFKDDPLSVLGDITAHAAAIDGNEGTGSAAELAQSVLSAAQSDTRGTYAQTFADKHNMSVAQYQKTIQQISDLVAQGKMDEARTVLLQAQTGEANARTGLIGAQTRKTNTETDVLIPSEAQKNYAQAYSANAQGDKTNLQVKDQLRADQILTSRGLPPGITPDKFEQISQDSLKTVQNAARAKSAAVANFGILVKTLGITPPDTTVGSNGKPQSLDDWFKALPAYQQALVAPAMHTLNESNQNLYNAEQNHNRLNTEISQRATTSIPKAYAAKGFKAVQHDGKWYMSNDGGKNLYRIPGK